MLRQAMKYGAFLIGMYVVVANASGFGTAFTAAANGVSGTTKALQGRG